MNPQGINTLTIPEATRVQRYKHLVPVIEDAAIVINSDILGAVVIKDHTVIQDSTVRAEQSVTPVLVESEAVIYNGGVHTAFREQTPAYIGEKSVVDGVPSQKAWVHGAELGAHTYVAKGAIIGDETVLKDGGVVAENAVVDIRKNKWAQLGGNFAEQKDGLVPLPSFDNWKATSDFKNTATDDRDSAIPAIEKIRIERTEQAHKTVKDNVTKYGEIYRLSPILQADILNLQTAIDLLPEKAPDLKALKGGLEYLIGTKEALLPQSARAIKRLANSNFSALAEARNTLQDLADQNQSLPLPLWKDAPGKSYHEAKQELTSSINPRTKNPVRRKTYDLVPDKILEPEKLINDRMTPTVEIYPEHLQLLSQQLERVHKHVSKIAEHYKNTQVKQP